MGGKPVGSIAREMVLPARSRREEFLRHLSRSDWGEPTGFAGRTCFQAIPALELARSGAVGLSFRWDWMEHSMALIEGRRDCQDFAMVGFVRMLYRFGEGSLLGRDEIERISGVLRGGKFSWEDPGEDHCCWHTENHQIQYLSSEFLLGQLYPHEIFCNTGRTGLWHKERARERLLRWLDWRFRFSFSEWNSSCYSDENAAALLNLAEYSEDPEIRQKAANILHLLFFHLFLNCLETSPAGSRGRAYLGDQVHPGSSPVGILLKLVLGHGGEWKACGLGMAATLLAAGDHAIPAVLLKIGRNHTGTWENKERHGLDPEEADEYGISLRTLEDFPLFAGAGLEHHHLLADTRKAFYQNQEKWPGFFASREFYLRCQEEKLAFDPRALPHALGSACVYSFRTPHYHLGCAQNYRSGAPGYQQFVWAATLGGNTVVFSTNPAPADVPYGRPGPWVGHGVLPKVVQHRNVLIALHRVRPCPIFDQPPWFREDRVHAYFPKQRFEECLEKNGWCFGRSGEAFVALRPVCKTPPVWKEPADLDPLPNGEYEWEVADTNVAWICEMGDCDLWGSFSAFVERITAAPVLGDLEHIQFFSPSLGLVETGWNRPLLVQGKEISIAQYPRFDNPFCQSAFDSDRITIQSEGEILILERQPRYVL